MGGGMDYKGTIEHIPAIIEAMANGDENAQREAAKLLVKIGEPTIPALMEALKSDKSRLRECASIMLAMIGEKAIPAVGELMKSENPEFKLSAMVTLAMIRADMEERGMSGETVDTDRFVKRPVGHPAKCQGDPTVRLRTERRSG
jgi:HEAT repeat protein